MVVRTAFLAIFTVSLLTACTGCRSADRTEPVSQPPDKQADKIQTVEEFWPDGTLRLRKQVLTMDDGTLVEHGRYTRWHTNGNKEYEANYVQGKLQGVETAWHKNGEKWTEQHYDQGLRQGRRRNWDDKGRLRGEEFYVKDRPHGTWTIWKGDGSVKWQGHYDHGTPLP